MTSGEDFIPDLKFTSGKFSLFGREWIGNGKRWQSNRLNAQIFEVYPRVFQGTDEFNWCKKETFKRLAANWANEKQSIENSLKYASVLIDFGYPANIAPYALNDVEITRNQKKLRNPTNNELELFEEYLRLIYGKGFFSRLRHSKKSSVGNLSFVVGDEFRKEAMKWFLRAGNIKHLAEMIRTYNVSEMSKLQFLPLYTQGTRKHTYNVDVKDGCAVSLKNREYILTKDILNHTYATTAVNFSHFKDRLLLAYDVRSMYAAPSLPNFANQIINNFLTNGLQSFDCFHYKGELDLSAKLKRRTANGKRGYIFSLDKSKFGDTFCPQLIRTFSKVTRDVGFNSDLCDIMDTMFDWPCFFRTVERDNFTPIQNRPFKVLDENSRFRSTFKSGNGLVSGMGQLIGGFDALLRMHAIYGKNLDIERALNNGYSDLFFMNKGDDTIWWVSDRLKDEFLGLQHTSLHADEIEENALFLGYHYKQDGTAVTDITRWLINTFCHERSFKSKSQPAVGFLARYELYKENPYFSDAYQTVKEIFLQGVNFDIDDWLKKGYDDMLSLNQVTHDNKPLNDAELAFLANPDLIYYKEEITKNVRQSLVDQFFSGTDPESFKFLKE